MFGIRKLHPLSTIGMRQIVGIDLSADYLKLAHLKIYPNNRKELAAVLSKNIAGLDDDGISGAVKGLFGELNVKTPFILDVISTNLVITKNIEIPSTDTQEIKDIINLQAGRHTPYSRDEIILDYIDIGTYKRSYTKILLIIVANSIIKRHIAILNKAGIKLEKVSFFPESLGLSVSKILKIDTGRLPVNIMHVDESFTDFTVVFKNKAIFTRAIPIGARQLFSEEEKYKIRFVEEAKKSLESYQNENIERNSDALILTGAVEGLDGLKTILNDALHLSVNSVSYFRNLIITENALKAISSVKYLSFFNVVSSLFACEDVKINLVSEEVKLKKAFEERGRDLIKTGVFVLTFFVLVFSILISKIYFGSVYLKKLDAECQSVSREAEKLENDFTKVNLVKSYLSRKGYALDVLAELYAVTPSDMEVTDIRFDEQGKFAIKGTAESMSTVFSFVDGMEKSKYFEDVKTKYASKRKDGLKDVTDFELVSVLEKGRDR